MKEFNIEKKEEQEESPMDKLKKLKEKDELVKREDSTHPTPLHAIDLDNLDPAVLKLYRLYDGGEIDTARTDIKAAGEKIEKIPKKEARENNKKFLNWIDKAIEQKFLNKELGKDQSLTE